MNVVIYTTPTCSFCHQAKEYLSNKGMEFIEHNVSVDKTAADDAFVLRGFTRDVLKFARIRFKFLHRYCLSILAGEEKRKGKE